MQLQKSKVTTEGDQTQDIAHRAPKDPGGHPESFLSLCLVPQPPGQPIISISIALPSSNADNFPVIVFCSFSASCHWELTLACFPVYRNNK